MRRKRFIKRSILIAFLLLSTLILQLAIPNISGGLHAYSQYFFQPFQQAKLWFFGKTNISFGDITYILLVALLAYNLGRIIYQLTHKYRRRRNLWNQGYFALLFLMSTYFLFVLLWGVNYKKPNLWKQWPESSSQAFETKQCKDLQILLVDSITQLCAQTLPKISDQNINTLLLQTYRTELGYKTPKFNTKFSAFGNMLQTLGINGYYNPITSEAQFNRNLPSFLHSFVMAHEMAHQAGIAAEGDANLMAYIICVQSQHPTIRYSGYLNIYLYNERALRMKDSLAAKELRAQLPQQANDDLVALHVFQEKHDNGFSSFSMSFYNYYLKMNGEDQGLKAYRNVNKYVYVWEFGTNRRSIILDGPSTF